MSRGAGDEMECFKLLVFGVEVRLKVLPVDLVDADFFYGHLCSESLKPRHSVDVELTAEDGFFASLLTKSHTLKTIRTRDGDQSPWVESSFRKWSAVPSPMPPFFSADIRRRLAVGRGAVLRSTSGVTCLLTGANYVGKTGVSLDLLHRGWDLISEHLLVMDQKSGQALPYLSPLGLRPNHLKDPGFRARVLEFPHRTTVSEVTGPVVLVRPFDLFPDQMAPSALIDKIFVLERAAPDDVKGVVIQDGERPAMSVYPEGASMSRSLPSTATTLIRGRGTPSKELADRIEVLSYAP